MRLLILCLTILCGLGAQAVPQKHSSLTASKPSIRTIPCKTAENSRMCFWVHGRLGAYNGNPSFRVWRIGTTRIIGIHSGPNAQREDPLDGEHPEFPAEVRKVAGGLTDGHRVFGDFEICPLTPDRAGEMQLGCIESAKNISVEK